MGHAGRPTSCTPETQEKILNALRAGNYRVAACKWAGIDQDTFCRWMRRAKTGEQPFAEFAEQVKQAEAQAEAALVATIRKAAADHWQAAAWLLERKYVVRWGRRDLSWERVQREARQAAQAEVGAIPLEELERMLEAEKARRARMAPKAAE
jgi:hypothetical protein